MRLCRTGAGQTGTPSRSPPESWPTIDCDVNTLKVKPISGVLLKSMPAFAGPDGANHPRSLAAGTRRARQRLIVL
jgi:hypothetical protein